MNKRALAPILIACLLASVLAVIQPPFLQPKAPSAFTALAAAQTYPPPDPTLAISQWYWNKSLNPTNDSSILMITAPQEGKAYNTSSINLAINVGATAPSFIYTVSYTADWPNSGNNLFFHLGNYGGGLRLFPTGLSLTLRPTGIPDGNHTITVYAVVLRGEGDGSTIATNLSNSINFTVDTTFPDVKILSPQNKSYPVSDVPLDFIVNESSSRISYNLDGQDNLINENTTLAEVPNGNHSLTIFVTDQAGNIAVSDNVQFTISVPDSPFMAFSITLMAIIVVVTLMVGLVIVKKKRHRKGIDLSKAFMRFRQEQVSKLG